MRIRALINLVVSANKEVKIGGEYDLNEADAKGLIEKGFAVAITKQPNNRNQNKLTENKEPKDNEQDDNEKGDDKSVPPTGEQGQA